MTTIYLVAGEASGDMHGAEVVRELRKQDPTVRCEGIGGPEMAAAGMDLQVDLASEAIMGFTEVVKSLGHIRQIYKRTVAHLRAHPPAALVLIDYPGFNLQLAKAARKLGIRVVWYISPQVWAWRRGRVKTLARLVDKMLVILPFEKQIYDDAGLDCVYVGHPLVEHLKDVRTSGDYAFGLTLGLLPGSRAQEIERIFPVMLECGKQLRETYPDARFVSAVVNEEREQQLRALAGDFPLEIKVGGMYEVLAGARFCLVASGTATVESTLFKVPIIVLYKTSPLTYWIARRVASVDHVAMVNILAEKAFVPEFLQHDAQPGPILEAAVPLIEEGDVRETMIENMQRVCDALGEGGASARAASEILAVANRT